MKIDTINLDLLKPAEYNPRYISEEEEEKLRKNMKVFGLVDPIIINLKNNRIIGGHQRYNILKEKYDKKDKNPLLSLIKLGDIGWVFEDEDLKIDDDTNEKALNIALNKISGEWDSRKLKNILDDLEEVHFDLDLTGFDVDFESELDDLSFDELTQDQQEKNNNTSKDQYVQDVNIPQYTLKGENPLLDDLYDLSYVNNLIKNIEHANITREQKEFLRYASYRHIIFNYEKIAEYYAHQNKEMQKLMEESMLVIIDFDDALKNEYVQLNKYIQEIIDSEEGENNEI